MIIHCQNRMCDWMGSKKELDKYVSWVYINNLHTKVTRYACPDCSREIEDLVETDPKKSRVRL